MVHHLLQYCLPSKLHCRGPIRRDVEGNHEEALALDALDDVAHYGALVQNYRDKTGHRVTPRDVCIHHIRVHVTTRARFCDERGVAGSVLDHSSDFEQEPLRRSPMN